MKRQEMIDKLAEPHSWDICIIGGGATGLGVALDAASRGFHTLLLEQSDFAKGTSSRSTKLVHGGVRYLQQGNIKLVTEALHERGILRKNAPHLVKDQSFIVPNYKWWEGPYYGIGLKVYDWMSGSLGLGPSKLLSKEQTLALAPTLDAEGLRGGVLYHDGQFDDARLAISLARTAAIQGAALINYCRVFRLDKTDGKLTLLHAVDQLTGKTYEIRSKAFVNCTGVFTDSVLHMDDPDADAIIAPSQGVHIVLDKSFLPGEAAILVPHTDDGRVLFAVPWHDKIIVGTTDTPITTVSAEPRALPEEIDFILAQIGRYLRHPPQRSDIRSVFAGLRPLVKSSSKKTAELSRDHLITISDSGLITITGGKWTTYRRMAEDGVNTAIAKAGLEDRPCRSATLPIHGSPFAKAIRSSDPHQPLDAKRSFDDPHSSNVTHTIDAARSADPAQSADATRSSHKVESSGATRSAGQPPAAFETDFHAPLYYYGVEAAVVRDLAKDNPGLGELLHERLPYLRAEIVWAARNEMCMTVEDALSRRTRALLLDARAALESAPLTAALLAKELGRDQEWQQRQIEAFNEVAAGYLP